MFVSYYTSPTNWLDVASRGVRELVADEIFSRELLPEVPSHADGCRRTEGTRGLAGCRVNYSNRHKFPCLLDGEPKIGFVRDHQRGRIAGLAPLCRCRLAGYLRLAAGLRCSVPPALEATRGTGAGKDSSSLSCMLR